MKNRGCLFLCAAALLASLSASALDRGGVTFDFQKISDARFAASAKTDEVNLIRNGDFSRQESPDDPFRWHSNYCHVHNAAVPSDSPIRRNVKKAVKWEIRDGVASIVKSPDLVKYCNGDEKIASGVSGGFVKYVQLAQTNGGTYKLSFSYRMSHSVGDKGYAIVSLFDKPENKRIQNILPKGNLLVFHLADTGGNWNLFSREFTVPAGINCLSVVVRIDGVGELNFRDVRLTETKAAEKITLKLSPHGFLDHTFAVSQNQPAVMTFVWKKNTDDRFSAKNLEFVLTLPAGYEFKGTSFAEKNSIRTVKTQDGGSEVRFRINPSLSGYLPGKNFNFYLRMPMMIATDTAVGTRGAASLRIEENGRTVSNVEPVELSTIPSVRAAHRPSRYFSGIYIGGLYLSFQEPAADALFAKLMGDAGVQWVVASPGTRGKAWRENGVVYITPENYWVANGFRVGLPEERPEADKYRYIGNSNFNLDNATCPAAVYEEREYFAKNTKEMIRKSLAGCDGLWGNWEPYMFAGKGCMCDTCRANFAKFVNVPLEQMKKEWPAELGRGKKYYDQIVRFRSLEHAKMVKTIHKAVVEATGGEKSLGFIPGIAWYEMSSSWRPMNLAPEVQAYDYADSLRWITPWGPYPCWDTQQPFGYDKKRMLSYFISARDVREQVNRDYPEGKRPKLMSFPHGLQLCDWVIQPENLELGMDAFFFNGFESTIVYAFPKGYDNRYWSAFARAVDTAGKYESYVIDGKRIDGDVQLVPVPEYAAPSGTVADAIPKYKNEPMLQVAAYRLGDKRIAAIFNFWEKGEAFFTFRLAGLDPEKSYTVTCGGDQFVPAAGRSVYTGAELAKGIPLHAGAARCAVYEILPAGKALTGKTLWSAEKLDQLYRSRRPELAKEAEADRKFEELNNPKDIALEDMSSAGIECKVNAEKQTMTFASKQNAIVLSTKEMSILEWTVKGRKLIQGNPVSGFGTAVFWEPSWQPQGAYRVLKQEKIKDGFRIVGEMYVTSNAQPLLEALKVRQTFEITDSCRKIALNTTLENASTAEAPRIHRFGLRYHCFPVAPALKSGSAEMTRNGEKVPYVRDYRQALFSTGDKVFEDTVGKTFSVKKPLVKITEADVVFRAPEVPALSLALSPEKEFAGFALWDSPKQFCSTFEPCFKQITLKPEEKISYGITAVAGE